jgi:tight adherence protein B
MVTAALSGLLGATVGFGLLLVARGLGSSGRLLPALPARRPRVTPRELGTACAVGLVSFVVTRWPMAFALGAAAFLGLQALGPSRARRTVAQLEAIAVWTEMLRDTLAGASGLTQALVTTAPTAPAPIAGAVKALAAKLSAGVALDSSLRELATDIGDPAADMVVAALLMASRERAQRLGELLGALSGSIRDEVAMRLGIEAERASSRSAVRMITGFSLGFFALMSVFARTYLAPYRSVSGQLALAGVGILFGLGLWLMSIMVRPKPLPRLVLAAEVSRTGTEATP